MRSVFLATLLAAGPAFAQSAVFLHPDGMGAGTWAALRLLQAGPDGRLAWDRLPATAVYVGPMRDAVTASSNGGATSHAWGVRADRASYGMVGGRAPTAASGAAVPLMLEAKQAGKRIGLVNSASVTEPGTGAMIASVADRRDEAAIAAQLLAARPDVLLGGGEAWFLPAGRAGRHGPGRRTDGRDLIAEARLAGYAVVFTAAELAAAPAGRPLLGLFAAEETFNEGSPEEVEKAGGVLRAGAPDWDVMVAAAIARLKGPGGYLLVANHEATDNLGGENAPGVLAGAAAADRAVALAAAEATLDGGLTLVVASDSDCGAMVATDERLDAPRDPMRFPVRLQGAAADGEAATPFLAAPDRAGRRLPFTIAWGADGDVAGGLVARGMGPGAARIAGTIDSTDVYRALRDGLRLP